ncbi:SDR family oxidoreductase [Adhaeribacter soli]|uniref:dTDP-4-dehydrorhamnose reductase n=1 Tax=Adhaeribacter soli TaxID=2607655 RepID=A0A5N1J085_9BACT|nr:SDR family oxidoreductase [Adhaeribacter soli]KAA9333653.1 SDR family oxidoreductase [Adhaeribacter soli]
MRLLITGSNGLLGQKLTGLLAENPEVELLTTSRGKNKVAGIFPEVNFRSMDITRPEEVQAVFENFRPTHVIHTAAQTNVDICETEREACYAQNVTAVQYLVEACEKYNTHFTHVSTDFIFDGAAGPYDEEAAPKPVNYYGQTKLEAEEIVKKAACPWAILRTVLVYGIVHDYGRSNIVLWVKNSLEAGKTIQVVDDQFRTPTLAEDLAQGCWLAAQKSATGIYNISGEELLTPYQMALQVADYFKLDASLIQKTDASKFTQPAKRPPRTGFVIEKAKKELGYKPHTFQEGIGIVAGQI